MTPFERTWIAHDGNLSALLEIKQSLPYHQHFCNTTGYCDIPEQFPNHTVDDPTTFFIKHPDPRVADPDKLMLDKIYLRENAYLTIRVHVTGSIEKSDIEGWGILS